MSAAQRASRVLAGLPRARKDEALQQRRRRPRAPLGRDPRRERRGPAAGPREPPGRRARRPPAPRRGPSARRRGERARPGGAARPRRADGRRLAPRRTASSCARCACRWASSPSSTRRGPTSPSTPPACASRPATPSILRGGSAAMHSNRILVRGRPGRASSRPACRARRSRTSRPTAASWTSSSQQRRYVDLVIPRGGEELKDYLLEHSKVPVIYAAGGNCHVYVDAAADLDKAVPIIVNAKCQRPGVCNAAETLLVHRDVAATLLPRAVEELKRRGVELVVDKAAADVLDDPSLKRANKTHYETEFLALKLAVRVVDSLDEALEHIATVRHASLRGDRHRGPRGGPAVHGRGRRGLRLRERLDAVHRRRRVRPRRRDGHLHAEAARARPHRPAGAHLRQVRAVGRRAGAGPRRDGRGASAPRRHRRQLRPAAPRPSRHRLRGLRPRSGSSACSSCRPRRRRTRTPSSARPPAVRLAMTALAVARRHRASSSPASRSSAASSTRATRSRPWPTRFPDRDLVFIMGSDSLLQFDTWHDPEGILALLHARRRAAARRRPAAVVAAARRAGARAASTLLDSPLARRSRRATSASASPRACRSATSCRTRSRSTSPSTACTGARDRPRAGGALVVRPPLARGAWSTRTAWRPRPPSWRARFGAVAGRGRARRPAARLLPRAAPTPRLLAAAARYGIAVGPVEARRPVGLLHGPVAAAELPRSRPRMPRRRRRHRPPHRRRRRHDASSRSACIWPTSASRAASSPASTRCARWRAPRSTRPSPPRPASACSTSSAAGAGWCRTRSRCTTRVMPDAKGYRVDRLRRRRRTKAERWQAWVLYVLAGVVAFARGARRLVSRRSRWLQEADAAPKPGYLALVTLTAPRPGSPWPPRWSSRTPPTASLACT